MQIHKKEKPASILRNKVDSLQKRINTLIQASHEDSLVWAYMHIGSLVCDIDTIRNRHLNALQLKSLIDRVDTTTKLLARHPTLRTKYPDECHTIERAPSL